MGSLSIWHWIIVMLVVMVLFGGRGKISSLMGDFAQGIKAFKKGMSEDDKSADAKTEPVKTIEAAARRRRKPSAAPKACAPDRCAARWAMRRQIVAAAPVLERLGVD